MKGAAEIRIGTSGWHYNHWRGPFYPEKFPASKMLEFYFQHFDTVELNNSFYKLPAVASLEMWRYSVPRGFIFAVKGSRYLTHVKRLNDATGGVERFFGAIDGLYLVGPKGENLRRISRLPAVGLYNIEWNPRTDVQQVILYFRFPSRAADGRQFRGVYLVHLDRMGEDPERADDFKSTSTTRPTSTRSGTRRRAPT